MATISLLIVYVDNRTKVCGSRFAFSLHTSNVAMMFIVKSQFMLSKSGDTCNLQLRCSKMSTATGGSIEVTEHSS